MTTETTTTSPPTAPPLPIVPIDGDALACKECGVRVPGPIAPENVHYAEALGRVHPSGHVGNGAEVPLTTCPRCIDRRALAADLAAKQLPHGVPMNGLRCIGSIAVDLVHGMLNGLEILGRDLPDASTDQRVLLGLVQHLGPVGGAAAWKCRFAPHPQAGADPDTCASSPWSHVDPAIRDALRRGRVEALAERLAAEAPPVALTPPALTKADTSGGAIPVADGCLLCGLAAVTVPAVQAMQPGADRTVWTYRIVPGPNALGGQAAPRRVAGYTCPVCTEEIGRAGVAGPTAMEGSLLRALGGALPGGWREGRDALQGVVGFGALVAQAVLADPAEPTPAPSAQPWEHLADLDELRARLTRELGLNDKGQR